MYRNAQVNRHSNGIKETMIAQLYGFGTTSEGELGLGGREDPFVLGPEPIALNGHQPTVIVDKVACGSRHTMVLLKDGRVFACGCNDQGQLGHARGTKRLSLVDLPSNVQTTDIACGVLHSAAISSDSRLYTWGSNEDGQLGRKLQPGPVSEVPASPRLPYDNRPGITSLAEVVRIACGGYHTLILCRDGILYACGSNSYGQLGVGRLSADSTGQPVFKPQPLLSLKGIPVAHIAAGKFHSVALTVSGGVFTWGRNQHGQLGVCKGASDSSQQPDVQSYPVHVKPLRSQKVVHVACGDDHTAALTYDGRLFTFGFGAFGQLGHGGKTDEETPKQVVELTGSFIRDVACGRCHTVAVTHSNVYSFGLGTSGQLGVGARVAESAPEPRRVPSIRGAYFTRCFAAGDRTILLGSSEPRNDELTAYSLEVPIDHLSIEAAAALLANPVKSSFEEVIESVFTSLASVNASFLEKLPDRFNVSSSNAGVRIDSARAFVRGIDEGLRTEERSSVRQLQVLYQCLAWHLVPDLPDSPPDIESMRVFLLLPLCVGPLAHITDQSFRSLYAPLARHFASLTSNSVKVLISWWKNVETRHFNRIVTLFKAVYVHTLELPPAMSGPSMREELVFRRETMFCALTVLGALFKVNKQRPKVPQETFYVNQLEKHVDIKMEYINYLNNKVTEGFTIYQFPFILNGAAKYALMRIDSQIVSQRAVQHAAVANVLSGIPICAGTVSLNIAVKRDQIVNDTFNQLLSVSEIDEFRRPLKVTFLGEEGDDAGGIRKEFFLLLFQKLMDYGLFVENDETRLIWFSHSPLESIDVYKLVGILFGLCVYNGSLVALPFPLALYKVLLNSSEDLGKSIGLEDLRELSPTEARSLEAVLDYEGDDLEEALGLTFEITLDVFGSSETRELKPLGSSTPVTRLNRDEYVELYIRYRLVDAVLPSLTAFFEGFHCVMVSSFLTLLQPQELMEVAAGTEHYDWKAFEDVTEYKGEYWRNHQTIQLFWRVFHDRLTLEQKKRFLQFLTGSDRIPILGMKELKMFIQPTSGGEQFYPVAHTCFNLLDLPLYTDEQTLYERLCLAIEHKEGFTLA